MDAGEVAVIRMLWHDVGNLNISRTQRFLIRTGGLHWPGRQQRHGTIIHDQNPRARVVQCGLF